MTVPFRRPGRAGEGEPAVILVGTGSKVAACVRAAERLAESGAAVRVVSVPSSDRFEEDDDDFRAPIFPAGVPVLAVEAAVTFGWHRYADDVVGIDRFGASAPGSVVLDRLGTDVDHVVDCATHLIAQVTRSHP